MPASISHSIDLDVLKVSRKLKEHEGLKLKDSPSTLTVTSMVIHPSTQSSSSVSISILGKAEANDADKTKTTNNKYDFKAAPGVIFGYFNKNISTSLSMTKLTHFGPYNGRSISSVLPFSCKHLIC